MKKLLLTLGSTISVVAPITAAISCGESETTNNAFRASKEFGGSAIGYQGRTDEEYTPVKKNPGHDMQTPVKATVTVNVRIPDWEHKSDYNDEVYNQHPNSYIKYWTVKGGGRGGTPTVYTAKMVPFNTVHKFVEDYKDETLGQLLDEINAKTHINYFSWNQTLAEIAESEKMLADLGMPVGESMGRFLTGVLKGDSKESEDELNSYYAIYQKQNRQGMWIKSSDRYFSYMAISSSTNPLSKNVTHETFPRNESMVPFDNRLPKGCDNIHLIKNDVINLDFWRMMDR